jgi:acetyltransferase-like isoleucine patch superfamily enzyme
LLRTIYIALGAQLGKNAYCCGLILNPHFVKVGENALIGMNALIVPHTLENRRAAQYPVIIGNNVTIGAHAIIQAVCTIGDNAIVAMGSVVRKHTTINIGEVWGGVPAKFLKKL